MIHTGTTVNDWKNLIAKGIDSERAKRQTNVDEKFLPALGFVALVLLDFARFHSEGDPTGCMAEIIPTIS